MKKKVIGILTLALLLLLAVGCSQHNQSFVEMLKEINSLERYTAEVNTTVSLKNAELSEALQQDGLPADLLEKIEVNYKLSADTGQMLAFVEFEVKAADKVYPLDMYIDNYHVYAKVDDLLQLIDTFSGDTELVNAYKTFFGDAQWVDLISEADAELYDDILKDKEMQEYLAEYDRVINALSKAYANFKTDTFSAMSNSYKFTFDNLSVSKLICDFFEYTVENCDHIVKCLTEYVNSSSLLSAEDKADLVQSLNEMAEAAAEVTKADIADFKTFVKDALAGDDCPFDFDFVYQISRISSAAYKQDLKLQLELEDDYIDPVKLSVTSESIIRENKSLELKLPDLKAAKLDDLAASAQTGEYAAKETEIIIYLDYNSVYCSRYYALPFLNTYDSSDISYKTIDDYTYLPLRQISEISGMTVEWDSSKRQPYVILNEQPVYLAAFVDAAQGITYIKIRDFEKLGFMVDYDPASNTITLIK